MIYGERQFLHEKSSIMYVDDPQDLYNWMSKNIKYKDFTKLMTAEEVYLQKQGSCHDMVQFELYFFSSWLSYVVPAGGVVIAHHGPVETYGTLFAIEYNDGETTGGRTHTFVWYIHNLKYYWFEVAWTSQRGIHGPYKNLKELVRDFKERMLKESHYKNVEFHNYPYIKIKPGMTLDEYVQTCLKAKRYNI